MANPQNQNVYTTVRKELYGDSSASYNTVAKALLPVTLIPDIASAAARQKLHKEIALWFILRTINTEVFNGYGQLSYDICKSLCQSHFAYHPWTFNRHLALGNDKFWDISEREHTDRHTGEITTRCTIRIRGLFKVAEFLVLPR